MDDKMTTIKNVLVIVALCTIILFVLSSFIPRGRIMGGWGNSGYSDSGYGGHSCHY